MIQPVGDRVLLELEKVKEKITDGGLILPEATQEKVNVAQIVAIGDPERMGVFKLGMRVIYEKFQGTEYKEDGNEYLVICVDDILAIKSEQ